MRRGAVALAALATACIPASEPSPPAALPPAPIVAQPLPPARIDIAERASQGGILLGAAPEGTVALTLDGREIARDRDGRFLLGFDRDAGPVARLVATLGDGRTATREIAVSPRAWRIERLDRLAKVPVPSADFQRRRPDELAAITAARATDHDSDGWRQAFVWPATGRISGLFGAQRIYRGEPGSYHSGVDVAKPTGAPVLAPADGVVTLAADREFTLEGHLLLIDHGMGLTSAFLHLSRIDVRVGDRVRQGQLIGAVGATGRATGPHLHWGLTWRGARLDPLLLAPAMVP